MLSCEISVKLWLDVSLSIVLKLPILAKHKQTSAFAICLNIGVLLGNILLPKWASLFSLSNVTT